MRREEKGKVKDRVTQNQVEEKEVTTVWHKLLIQDPTCVSFCVSFLILNSITLSLALFAILLLLLVPLSLLTALCSLLALSLC